MPAAGRSSISARRRSLVTATAAGAVLCALWFVPTAKATPDAPGAGDARHAATSGAGHDGHADRARDAGQEPSAAGSAYDRAQAASGTARPGPDGLTTPALLSGLGLAAAGGALIVRTRRRAAVVSSRSAQASSPVAD